MTDGLSRFTSDRRTREESSWTGESDWVAGTAENVDVVDGNLVSRSGSGVGDTPDSVIYDFETGDLSRWDVAGNASIDTSRVYEGSYAVELNDGNVSGEVMGTDPYDGNEGSPSTFVVYWNERSGRTGGGIRLFDGNGNNVLGLATDNPQWYIDDNNGPNQVYSGTGYDRWIRFTVTFDWSAETFDVDFEDLSSGATYTDTDRPLKTGNGISRVGIWSFNTGDAWNDSGIGMWFDNIRFET